MAGDFITKREQLREKYVLLRESGRWRALMAVAVGVALAIGAIVTLTDALNSRWASSATRAGEHSFSSVGTSPDPAAKEGQLAGIPFNDLPTAHKTHIHGLGVQVDAIGHVLTTLHLVEDCRSIEMLDPVHANHTGEIIAFDRYNDLALLKTPPPKSGTVLGVIIRGFPLAGFNEEAWHLHHQFFHDNESIRLELSRIADLGRNGDSRLVTIMGNGSDHTPFYQGDSGGPVFDKQGRLLGILVGILPTPEETVEPIADRIGFMLGSPVIEAFLHSNGIDYLYENGDVIKTVDEKTLLANVHEIICKPS